MQLILLSRGYCHLCDEMKAALEQLQGRLSFALHEIDVDSNPALESEWGEQVPVLFACDISEATRICHYHLDRRALEQRLKQVPSQ